MFANLGIYPVDMKVGPNGDLFFVDIAFGAIRQITYTGDDNRAPTAHAVASPAYGPAPLEVGFDASGSTDPDEGDTLTYAWDLDGDGDYDDSTEEFPRTTYDEGTHNVSLRVTDSHGASHDDDLRIDSGETPPSVSIDTPTAALNWHVGQNVNFSGSATDEQDGTLPASALSWKLIINHCITVDNCHAHPVQDFDGVASGSFVAPDHGYPSHLLLQVTATDSRGLTDSKTIRLDPQTVNLTRRTRTPPNLNVSVDEKSGPGPLVHEAIVGATTTISAESPQLVGLDLLRVRLVVGRQGAEPRGHGAEQRHDLHGELRPAHEADVHAGRRRPGRGGALRTPPTGPRTSCASTAARIPTSRATCASTWPVSPTARSWRAKLRLSSLTGTDRRADAALGRQQLDRVDGQLVQPPDRRQRP